MLDFFIALFGGAYYLAKDGSESTKRSHEIYARNAAYEREKHRKSIDATISVSENTSEQLSRKIDGLDGTIDQQWIYDEL